MDDLLSPPLEDLDHLRGERGAPLELVMFGDFQCPFCLGAQSVLRRVRERLGDRLLFGFRHLPIPERHPLAPLAAEASEAAAAQGRFWEYHDALFDTQSEWSPLPPGTPYFGQLAARAGVDSVQLRQCMESRTMGPLVEADYQRSVEAMVRSTPTFMIGNDTRLEGAQPISAFREAIARVRAGRDAATGHQ